MILIAAVDEKWGIGQNGKLLVRLSADLRRFRQITLHNVILMGRKTLESFPDGKPLSDRINVVLTNNRNYQCPPAVTIHSLWDIFGLEKKYHAPVFIVGGESVYKQLLPYCQKAYITKIKASYIADAFLPNLDLLLEWVLTHEEEEQEENGIRFSFCTYEKLEKGYGEYRKTVENRYI